MASVLVIVLCGTVTVWMARAATFDDHPDDTADRLSLITLEPTPTVYPVEINQPKGAPTVRTDVTDPDGRMIDVACSTCHATLEPSVATRRADQLDEFHEGLTMEHGELTCLSCHNPANYDQLRRADGTSVEYPRVMDLCAQCHGPQHRDYQNGSHGGMTGHWDLTRGPRQRNNCVDCHDAHAPKYPMMQPVFPPHDRIVVDGGSAHE